MATSLMTLPVCAHGQLGLGDLADQLIPVDIKTGSSGMSFSNDPIADVAAQGNLSMLLTNTGKVTISTCGA